MATPRISFYDWREDLAYVADVQGIPEKGDEVLAAYDARIAFVEANPDKLSWGEIDLSLEASPR